MKPLAVENGSFAPIVTGNPFNATSPFTFGNADSVVVNFAVPIVGLNASPSTILSNAPIGGSAIWAGGTGKLFSSTATSWTDVSDTDFATRTNTGSAGNPASTSTLGFKFTSLPAGRYKVDANIPMYFDGVSANGTCRWRITDGTNVIAVASLTDATASGIADQSASQMGGEVNYASTADREIKIQVLKEAAGSFNCNVDFSDTDTMASMTLIPLDRNFPAPVLVGSVTSNSTGAERIERARITVAAGTPAVGTQSGTWISSVSDGGAGLPTLNLTAGTFSSAPTCVCSSEESVVSGSDCMISGTSTSAINVRTRNTSASLADEYFQIICMGPR